MMATAAELSCPLLLFAGLAARLGAAALIAMTIVIQVFVYPTNWPEHLLWASLLAYVISRGAGVLSADHMIGRMLGR